MGLMRCPDCGCTISTDKIFCPGCGTRVKTRIIYPGKAKNRAIPVRCPWCGETVPAGRQNCPKCGSPAKISYSPEPDDPNWKWESDPLLEKRKRKLPLWLVLTLAFLCAGAVILGVFAILGA